MRSLLAAALIALMAGSAYAQGGVAGKRRGQAQSDQHKENPAKKKAEEKAYQDALEKIPDAKDKPDPWKTMR